MKVIKANEDLIDRAGRDHWAPSCAGAQMSGDMVRILACETHGQTKWQGHVMCDGCGETYQTREDKKPRNADGTVEATKPHEGADWSARPICYLCFRRVAKKWSGRIPVERFRGQAN